MGYVQDELKEAIGRKWFLAISIIIGMILFYIILALAGSFWPFSSAVGVVKKVTSSEYIIDNYEWFYDMQAQIKATANKAKIAKGTEEEKGIKMVLESMIGEYNARSRMTTRTLWKASDLPYEIESGVQE